MRQLIKRSLLGLLAAPLAFQAAAQEVQQNNQGKFDPVMYRQGSPYRSALGVPGESYWQNDADYNIAVSLDDQNHILKGSITLIYENNSPQPLDFIWMNVEQNRFTATSRGTLTTPIQGNRYNGDTDGGYTITNLQAKVGKRGATSSKHLISDTRMQVFFSEPIPAEGGVATVSMDFEYKIPQAGMDRMGRLDTENGTIYSLAQWYPRVAVYDDIKGWNVEPYLGAGEFYTEYGDYEFSVTVPYDHIVVGSGTLVNANNVLTAEQRKRMDQAASSDDRVYIITPDEVANPSVTRPKQSGTITWKYSMENTRDVAFATSKAFIWDAARINLASGTKSMAQSVYPKEVSGNEAWGRSTEYTKRSVEITSEHWYEYPYSTAINVASNVGGMEYPGMSFCSWESKGRGLWGVTNHEFGHNWFPMIVGSNERLYPWMDEGFNTFINHYVTEEFNNGEYSSSLTQPRRNLSYYTKNTREGIDTYPDIVNISNLGNTAYYKPAIGLMMLREYVLGHERFDYAFKNYISKWAYKHPQPADFFNAMENASGENLNWFWNGWFYGNANIDLALSGVYRQEGGYILVLENRGELPMPVKMEVVYEDGTTEQLELPVEIWQRGNSWNHFLHTDNRVKSITIDPKRLLPDINSSNDSWPNTVYQD